jgi:hypothetical protein
MASKLLNMIEKASHENEMKEWLAECLQERNVWFIYRAYDDRFMMQIGERDLKVHKIKNKSNSALRCFAYVFHRDENNISRMK